MIQFKTFTDTEHRTWRELFERQKPLRTKQMHPIFEEGIRFLEIEESRVADLDRINKILKEKTGFVGVPVTGHEDPRSFFPMLANREFPIGNFIRDAQDINYTPAPDVFHDLYGHLPFFVNESYANAVQHFGEVAAKYINIPEQLRQWERLYWFGYEFALVDTPLGTRILGAGIASSFGECAYSLSDAPDVLPFDANYIRNHEFRIDEMQKKLFKLTSPEQLYECVDDFDRGVRL